MAEFATPSAAMMATADITPAEKKKPEKPDEEVYQKNLKQAQKEHAEAKAKLDELKAKLDSTGSKAKDSPVAQKRQELINQLTEIRKQQGAGKSGRTQVMDQIKRLDEQLKSRINEQKAARSRVPFKNVEEVDREITRLDKLVESSTLKLVDERKSLEEITKLRKLKKGFSGFEEAQKGIDDTKAKIKELRDSLDDPEAKALSDKYNKIQDELNVIKAEQDEIYQNKSALREERDRLHKEQQVKYTAMKTIQDNYYQQKKAFQNYEYEARQRARERRKAEQEKYFSEKKKERAQQVLAEATVPAYLDEIKRADSLLRYLDPTYVSTTPVASASSSAFAAPIQRTIDDSGIKGARVMKKDDREEEYFKGTGGKKGKKNRGNKEKETAKAAAKFSCPPSVMEDCSAMGIEPPMSAADVPGVVEKVKAKLDHWKEDQKVQTEKNIAKAKKEIERLDAEDSSPSTPTTNGHAAKTEEKGVIAKELDLVKTGVAQIAADLTGASVEDNIEDKVEDKAEE